MHHSTEKTTINVIKSYIVKIYLSFRSAHITHPMAEARAGEDFVDIDKEWTEGTLEEASKYVAEIVEMFSDFGDPSKSVCNEGKTKYSAIILCLSLLYCFQAVL